MIFQQFLDDDLGCACYLIGDEEAGIAVVVDPPYAIEQLLVGAERQGVRIVRVIETHTHADHLSGHGRLALEHGLPVSIHPAAGVDYPHDPIHDGDELEVGAITLRVVHTPGHRPEHCCPGGRPTRGRRAVARAHGRLAVRGGWRAPTWPSARERARGLYHSLQRLMELPDRVEVFPGHVAGSLCGKAMSSKPSTTIGFERLFNPPLQLTELDTFVADAAAIGAPKPPNLARIVEHNRGPFLAAPATVAELAVPPADTQLLDVRPVDAYLAGHRPGRSTCRCPGRALPRRPAS